jgi:hypothetical protein
MYILAQTFYVDPNAVANSSSVLHTGVDLYFKSVPSATNNRSGITNPGIHVSICDTNLDGSPNFDAVYSDSQINVPYSSIIANSSASTATTITWPQPVALYSGKKYAIRIQTQDPDFELWSAVAGQYVANTTTVFPGFATGFQGALYDYATDGTVTPRAAENLTFNSYVAQFSNNCYTFEYVNDDLEFLTITNQNGSFVGGDIVFTIYANVSAQTVTRSGSTIVGTGTKFLSTFPVGSYIAVWGTGNPNGTGSITVPIVRKVTSVANDTSLTVATGFWPGWTITNAPYFKTQVGEVYYHNQFANTLYINKSTANSTLYFQPGQQIAGSITFGNNTTLNGGIALSGVITANIVSVDNLPISQIHPEFGVKIPTGGSANIQHSYAYFDGANYRVSTNNFTNINNLETATPTYNGLVMSRSNEVSNPTYLYGGNTKSVIATMHLCQSNSGNGLYTAPYTDSESLNSYVAKYLINNDASGENTTSGNAQAKHITTQMTFASGKSAEGLFLYLTAYQPLGTSILAYAKLYNSKDPDTFNSKDWTQLVTVNNTGGQYSTVAANNYVELDFGLPIQPPSLYTANGTVTTYSNSTIIGSGTNFGSEILLNDVVKVYSPFFPNTNYQVAVVTAIANTTSLTLSDPINGASLQNQSGFYIDKISLPKQAFINPQNSNVVCYFNSSLTRFDTYDTAQFKIVLLSNNVNIVPRMNSLRAVGVSA